MADLNGIGQMLQGIGAGFSGQLPQYQQAKAMREEAAFLKDERRRQALIRDLATVYSMGSQGQWEPATRLLENRVEQINRLGGDPSDTMGLLNTIKSGKTEEALAELGSFVQVGMMTGDIKGGDANNQKGQTFAVTNPETGQIEMVGSVFDPRSGQWTAQRVPMGGGEIVGASGVAPSQRPDQKYRETAAVEAARLGYEAPRAQAAAAGSLAGELGLGGGPSKADVAASVTDAQGAATRGQDAITAGIDAGKSLPTLRRAKTLLDGIETGGISKVAANAKKWFGVESADQAELTNLIGKQVVSQLKPTFGAQFTVKEGEWLKDMEAGWGTSTAGNKRLLEQGIRLAEKRAEIGQREATRRKDAGAVDQIEQYRTFSLDVPDDPLGLR